MRLFRFPLVACTLSELANAARSMSLVLVFPFDPATAMTARPHALRQAVAARSAELAGLPAVPPGAPAGTEIPANLREFVDKAALHAYRITDEEVAALRRAGYSEDAIFETAISAAIGGGLARLERGLAALEGGKR
jgi:hypothetical protein